MDLTRRKFIVSAGQIALAAGAATAVGACSSGSSGGSGKSGGGSQVNLSLWYDHPEWEKQFNTLVSQFEQQNPGIKISPTAKSGAGYQPAIDSALATGSAPDLFKADAGGSYADVVKGNHFHDLTGKLTNISNLNEAAAAVTKINGKVYGAPILGQYNIGIYYWLDTFAKYNLQPPTTWAEWVQVCETLQTDKVVPLLLPASDGILPTFLWTSLLTTVQGPSAIPKITSGQLKITDPDFQAATTYLHSLVQFFDPGYLSIGINSGDSLFAFKKAAMIVGGSADYAGFQSTNPAVTGKLGYFAIPAPPGKQPAVTIGVDGLFGINTSVTDPAKIAAGAKFIDWWMTTAVGSQVSDTIELSCVKGATTSNPMFKTIIAASTNNGPTWFEPVPLTPLWNYSQSNIEKMFTGALSPAAFTQGAQSKIKPSA